jgi:hypothetical protein
VQASFRNLQRSAHYSIRKMAARQSLAFLILASLVFVAINVWRCERFGGEFGGACNGRSAPAHYSARSSCRAGSSLVVMRASDVLAADCGATDCGAAIVVQLRVFGTMLS